MVLGVIGVAMPAVQGIEVAGAMHRMDRHALKARLFEIVNPGGGQAGSATQRPGNSR